MQQLQQGQLWKLKRNYVYIVELVDSNIAFKLLTSPNKTAERTLTSGQDTLLRYLVSRKGRLVRNSEREHRPAVLTNSALPRQEQAS